MSLAFLFHYFMLNMFRMLIHPSSGALPLICWVISWVVLLWYDACWCYVVVWLGGVVFGCNKTHEITQQISRNLLRMDLLTSETCWAWNNEIKSKWHQIGLPLFNYQDDTRSSKHKIGNTIYRKATQSTVIHNGSRSSFFVISCSCC